MAATRSGGFDWLLGVVHEVAHANAGPGGACLFLPNPAAVAPPPQRDVCPAMAPPVAEQLVGALADAGVDPEELLEPVRLFVPAVSGHEHVIVLPLAWRDDPGGVLAIAAPTPPLGGAALARVMEFAGTGLGWLADAEEGSARLRTATEASTRLAGELDRATLLLDLQECLVPARAVGEVVARLASWLDAPVALQMPNLVVVEAAGPGARDLALCRQRGARERAVLDGGAGGRLPLLGAEGRVPPRAVVVVGGPDGTPGGFLIAAVGPRGHQTTVRALGVADGFISYQLGVREDIERSAATLRHHLLADLLADRYTEDIATQAAKLGHDLKAAHVPVAVGRAAGEGRASGEDGPSGAGPASGAGPGAVDDRLVRLVEHGCGQASAAAAAPLVGTVADMVVALVPTPVPAGIPALAHALEAGAAAAGIAVVIGIGPTCAAPADIAATARKARWAVEVLRATAGEGTARTAQFDDLGVYGLLFEHGRAAELAAFAQRWVGPLVEYDRRHRSELVETLRQVFRQRSLADAASALHVHVSTLKYRVGRIEEILGRSIDVWENVFNLELALRLVAVSDQSAARGLTR